MIAGIDRAAIVVAIAAREIGRWFPDEIGVVAVDRIAARYQGGTVLVVSHGAAIKSFTAHVLSTTTLRLRPLRPVANTGATLFERSAEGALSLLVYNDTTHLEDALAAALAS